MTQLLEPNKPSPRFGLVLSGGGARGAYEAGVMHYVRTMLPKDIAKKAGFDIYCGSSVGAINTCFLAATAHDLNYQGNRIYELWRNLSQDDIYLRDAKNTFQFLKNTAWGIARNLFTKKIEGHQKLKNKHLYRGFLNTTPLFPFLKKIVPWKQISVNIENGFFDAISITATNMASNKLELFIEKHPDLPYTGHYQFHDTKLEAKHAIASAAIPLIFPAVRIKNHFFMDGSIRMNTPLSPAIQLGADKLFVVRVHHGHESSEFRSDEDNNSLFTLPDSSPTIGSVLGTVLTAIFNDKLEYDIEQLGRINRLIDWGEGCFGPDFLDQINSYLHEKHIKGDIANRGLKKLTALKITPSEDPRTIFQNVVNSTKLYQKQLTGFEKTIFKILDVDFESGLSFLSFILFIPEYIQQMLDLGFEDARAKHDEIVEFFSDHSVQTT